MINRKVLYTAILLFFAVPLFAQIGIALSLNRTHFICYEHIFACVTLRNNSGRPLLFGQDPSLQGFLLFDIRDEKNKPVPFLKNADLSVTGIVLGAGEVRKLIIPLDRFYDLRREGHYKVHAFVSHNMLAHEYRSADVSFRISEGLEIWSRRVGIPKPPQEKDNGSVRPQERIYSIRSIVEDSANSYYLVVEDEQKIYGVTKIGNSVGKEKFQAEIDMLCRIHLLMPLSPKVFHYIMFNVDGTLLENSYWKTASTIPMLFRDSKSGKVTRIGGVAARAGIDFRDPKEGRLTISEILQEDKRVKPTAPEDGGLVDLGGDSFSDDEETEEEGENKP